MKTKPITKQDRVIGLIAAERARQEELVRTGKLPFSCAEPMLEAGGDHAVKLAILTEEIGEVAREVYERSVFESPDDDPDAKLRTELVQVAAVAVAWLEALEPKVEAVPKMTCREKIESMAARAKAKREAA